jgi:hypothetical protein
VKPCPPFWSAFFAVQVLEFYTVLLPVNLKLSSHPFWGMILYASDFGSWLIVNIRPTKIVTR